MSNTLSFYRTVKRLGIPDSNIILMLADDVACNPRNAYPGEVYNNDAHSLNVYGSNVEVDYRGYEVTVENFIRVLTGRHDPAVPRAKRMLSDRGSNVLVYISGHGGNEFMKFQDTEELMAADVADALAQMWEKGRYREVLLIVETCQAATLYSRIRSPNVLAMASSLKGESSYSYLTDMDVGLSLIDRFTYASLDFFERVGIHSAATMEQLVRIYRYDLLESHFVYRSDLFRRPLDSVRVTDFFGSVSEVRTSTSTYPLQPPATAAAVAAAAAHPAGGGSAAAVGVGEGEERLGATAAAAGSCQAIGAAGAEGSGAGACAAPPPGQQAAPTQRLDAGDAQASAAAVLASCPSLAMDWSTWAGMGVLLVSLACARRRRPASAPAVAVTAAG